MFLVYVSAILTTGLFGNSRESRKPRQIHLRSGDRPVVHRLSTLRGLPKRKGPVDAMRIQERCDGHKTFRPLQKKEQVEDVKPAFLRKGTGYHQGRAKYHQWEVIEGAASVDESAITGESAPIIRRQAATEAQQQEKPPCCQTGSKVRVTYSEAREISTR